MLSTITRNWWLAALRGALAVLFGIVSPPLATNRPSPENATVSTNPT